MKCKYILLSFQPEGESCLFEDNSHVGNNCRNGGTQNNATKAHIDNIIHKSRLRNDLLHLDLELFNSKNAGSLPFIKRVHLLYFR